MKATACLLLLITFSITISCSNYSSSSIVEEAIIVDSLVSEQFLEEEVGLAPLIVGPYLLIMQDQNRPDKVVFTVYNSSNLEFLGNIGLRGRQGPDTFYGASYWGQYEERNGDYLIWVNDPPRFRVSLINITKSLQEGRTVIERRVTHKPEYDFMNALFVVDSVGLVGHQPGYQNGTNMAPLVMLRNGEFQLYGEYPKVNNILDEERWKKWANFNSVSLSMKPDQSRFAVAMDHYDRLDIFDRDGQFIMSYRDPEKYALYNYSDIITPSKSVPKQYKDYYYGTAATEDFLFTLYYDVSVEKWDEFHPTTIRIFDWDGNLKAELFCPDKLWNLSVDEENGYLYGGSYQQETLFRYNIESVLKALKANP